MEQTKDEIRQEVALVQRAQQDPQVFGLLYEKYYKPIFVFIYKRVDDEQLTADLTSQVFLKAMLHLSQWKFKGVPFSAWLFRIAVNQVNEYFRDGKRQRTIRLRAEYIEHLSEEVEVLPKNLQNLLPELLGRLSEQEVTLIELRYFEQRSFKEVAFILNISETNAKVRVHRILKKLKKYAQA